MSTQGKEVLHLTDLYENWFLDYASYVILERAVPSIEDGLKPVQRRILHAINEMDDGRFNKVANVIGATMQFHPHGDASIGDAMVNLGQKNLLIETQGNWGDVRTGDNAAAPRYIEARLSKFAKEVAFNDETTEWQMSYDGRKREPLNLPMKFPLLLAQGVEGIAVGLSTKVLPHNFCELIEASIACLKKESFQLFPDFETGGMIDIKDYKDGERGGKVRVRAKLEILDKKSIVIRQVPYGVTTTSIMDSIVKANDNGKIKIKKVTDNTAKEVEIIIEILPGISPEVTLDALYAFTDCEVSISPNACVIVNNKPCFLTVSEILRLCTDQTKDLLKRELEIQLGHLQDKWHFSSLEKIFIEEKIYRELETQDNWESALDVIEKRLQPFLHLFKREITREDIARLPEIPIRRIGKFDKKKADEYLKSLDEQIAVVQKNLQNLTKYTIQYFQNLLTKYGKNKERKTEIRVFDTINVNQVAALNQKLYVNTIEGFVGYGLKKDEFVSECSDMDDIIAFTKDGKMKVVKIAEKTFIGKDIIHCAVFKKNDERTTYNVVYTDGIGGTSFVKRFHVTGITRDKEYDLTKGSKGSKILHFTCNPNGEAEKINVFLSSSCKAKIKQLDFDFAEIAVKGRQSAGNQLTKYPIRKVNIKEIGASTLGGIQIYFDPSVGRLNTDKHGQLLGEFNSEDCIVVFYKDGSLEMTNYDLTNRYETQEILRIEQFEAEKIYSIVHHDGSNFYVKRFKLELITFNKKQKLISEEKNAKLHFLFGIPEPLLRVDVLKGKSKAAEVTQVKIHEFIEIKGWKAQGNRLSQHEIDKIIDITPPPIVQGDLFDEEE